MKDLAVAVNLFGPFCNCFFLKEIVLVTEKVGVFYIYLKFWIDLFIYMQILDKKFWNQFSLLILQLFWYS